MGGPGSGRPARWPGKKQHISLAYNFEHGESTERLSLYMPVNEFEVLQKYAWSINMDHTTLIKTYIAEYFHVNMGDRSIPECIRYKPGYETISDYIWHIVQEGLKKDGHYQKFKENL